MLGLCLRFSSTAPRVHPIKEVTDFPRDRSVPAARTTPPAHFAGEQEYSHRVAGTGAWRFHILDGHSEGGRRQGASAPPAIIRILLRPAAGGGVGPCWSPPAQGRPAPLRQRGGPQRARAASPSRPGPSGASRATHSQPLWPGVCRRICWGGAPVPSPMVWWNRPGAGATALAGHGRGLGRVAWTSQRERGRRRVQASAALQQARTGCANLLQLRDRLATAFPPLEFVTRLDAVRPAGASVAHSDPQRALAPPTNRSRRRPLRPVAPHSHEGDFRRSARR